MKKHTTIIGAIAFSMFALIGSLRLACLCGYRSRRVVVAFNTEAGQQSEAGKEIIAFNGIHGSEDAVVIGSDNEKRTAHFFVPFGETGPVQGKDLRDKKTKPTMQRFDIEAANAMIADLNTLRGKIARKFRMIPIYDGHPDVPELSNVFTDRSAKGWIVGANVGQHDGKDGIVFEGEMTPRGMAMIRDEEFVFNSPRWSMKPITAANDARQIAVPSRIISLALTNTPLIKDSMNFANVDFAPGTMDVSTVAQMLGMEATATYADVVAKIASMMEIVAKMSKGARLVEEAEWSARAATEESLVQANTDLAAARAEAANEKALAQTAAAQLAQAKQEIETANTAHAAEIESLKSQIANGEALISAANTATAARDAEIAALKSQVEARANEITAANTLLAAERTARAGEIVATAIEEGRLLPAHKDAKVAEIVAANCSPAIIEAVLASPVVIKTASVTRNLGARKAASEQHAALIEAANTEHAQHGGDFTEIYLRLKRARGG